MVSGFIDGSLASEGCLTPFRNVRFRVQSGREQGPSETSAYDPKQTFAPATARCLQSAIFGSVHCRRTVQASGLIGNFDLAFSINLFGE